MNRDWTIGLVVAGIAMFVFNIAPLLGLIILVVVGTLALCRLDK